MTGYELGLSWLLRPGLQVGGPAAPFPSGGMCHEYDLTTGKLGNIYTEITGYSISCFLAAYRRRPEPELLNRARRAGDFLLELQRRAPLAARGAMAHCVEADNGHACDEYYSFDVGMCITGLVDLYRAQPEARYLEGARLACRWLIEVMQRPDGLFRSCQIAAQHDTAPRFRKYSPEKFEGDGGSLHLKLAIPLLRTGRETGDQQLLKAGIRLLDRGRELQQGCGAFPANHAFPLIFLHAHCYAAEGYAVGAQITGDVGYRDVLLAGANWLTGRQRSGGGIPREINSQGGRVKAYIRHRVRVPTAVDATAQAVRLWFLTARMLDPDRESRKAAARLLFTAHRGLDFLNRVQLTPEDDPRAPGAFPHQIRPFSKRRPLTSLLYPWPVMFALGAMRGRELHESGAPLSAYQEDLF